MMLQQHAASALQGLKEYFKEKTGYDQMMYVSLENRSQLDVLQLLRQMGGLGDKTTERIRFSQSRLQSDIMTEIDALSDAKVIR